MMNDDQFTLERMIDQLARMMEAAEEGCDGSTHGENCDDFQEYADQVYGELYRAAESEEREAELDAMQAKLNADILRCVRRHEANGSIDEQVG